MSSKLHVACVAGAAVVLGYGEATYRDVSAAADMPVVVSPDAGVSGGTVIYQEGRDGFFVLDGRSPVEVVAPRRELRASAGVRGTAPEA